MFAFAKRWCWRDRWLEHEIPPHASRKSTAGRRLVDVAGKDAGRFKGCSNACTKLPVSVRIRGYPELTAEVLPPATDAQDRGSVDGAGWSEPAPYLCCQPVDADLARTVTEHVHCGEPMVLVSDTVLPITAPLTIVATEAVPPERRRLPIPIYRCECGFALDAPMHENAPGR